MHCYDVAIVGAGISGSYLANLLTAKGIDVILLEKHKKLIHKDSGIVSTAFTNFLNKKFISSYIKEMKFTSQTNNSLIISSSKPFACIINRKNILKNLRKNCNIHYSPVLKLTDFTDHIDIETEKQTYSAKMIIGADGANSLVREYLNIKPPKTVLGIMEHTKKHALDNIEIFFNKYFSPDFFAWKIPPNNEHGLISAIRPYEYFNYFKKTLNLPDGKIYASLISIGFTKSYSSSAILIGDACGQVKPLTGGGIIFSLTAAKYAASVVSEAVKQNNFTQEFLSSYQQLWMNHLAPEINKQLVFRKIYRNLTNKQIDKLFNDFGPSISKIDFSEIDYDHPFRLWRYLPKWKLFKFIIMNLKYFI